MSSLSAPVCETIYALLFLILLLKSECVKLIAFALLFLLLDFLWHGCMIPHFLFAVKEIAQVRFELTTGGL